MRKYSIFAILIMFLTIYEPPLIRINLLHILGAFSWLYILIHSKIVSKVIRIKKVLLLYVFLMLLWSYLLIVVLVNNASLSNTLSPLYWAIDIIPISIMLSIHLKKKKFNIYDFLNSLLISGALQGILAIGAFLFPAIQVVFIRLLVAYGHGEYIQVLSQFRMYGLASNLTYSTPLTQSVLGVLSIWLAVNSSWKYILFSPLFIFSSIINARISLIVFMIGLVLILILKKNMGIKTIAKTLTLTFILFLIISLGIGIMEKYSPSTYDWVIGGIGEINLFFGENKGSSYSYYNYFTGADRYVLPQGFGLLFGVGIRVMHNNKYGVLSDIGYVNDIWLGGVLYAVFIYLFFLWIVKGLYNKENKFNQLYKFIYLLALSTLFISNIKGYIFAMNNFTNMLFLMFGFICLIKEEAK